MKLTTTLRILNVLCIAALAFASTTCKKEKEPEYVGPKCAKIIVTDGWITNPKWLVDEVDRLSYVSHVDSVRYYSRVHHIEYNEESYIFLELPLGYSGAVASPFYYCIGERVAKNGLNSPPDEVQLLFDLMHHRSHLIQIGKFNETLIWRQPQ